MQYTNINGRLIPSNEAISIMGQITSSSPTGLLETMLVTEGHLQLAQYHWERLSQAAKMLATGSLDTSLLENEILHLVHQNGLNELSRIRLRVFPGESPNAPQYFIECLPLPPDITPYNREGLTIGIAPDIHKDTTALSNLKTTERTHYDQASTTASSNGWADALILNHAGNIIETTVANVFWVKDHSIYTPPLSEGCVAGIMRRHVIKELAAEQFKVHQAILTEATLFDASEVFISNAIRRIKWVGSIGPHTYSNKVSSEIASLLFA